MTLGPHQIGMNIASMAGWELDAILAHGLEAGLGAIELLGFTGARHSQGDLAGVHLDRLSDDARAALVAKTEGYRIKAVHAPFIDLPLFSHNRAVAELAEAQIRESIRLVQLIGGGAVVIHPNAKRNFDPGEYRQEMLDAFRRLGDAAGEAGAVIAIENMPDVLPETQDKFCALIWNVDHPAVGACLDTGHVLGMVPQALRRTDAGNALLSATVASTARTLAEKLAHVHIHDVRAHDWRDHREVGRGVIDYAPLFGALTEIGYSGALSLELEEPDRTGALARSVARIRGFIDAIPQPEN